MLAKLIQDRQKSKILNRKREKNLSERIYPLDTLKFTAAILIVFHHFQQSTGAWFSGINFYGGKFYFGNLVELFFILSGFFVGGGIRVDSEVSFTSFMEKKIIRLYPMAMLATFTYILIAWGYRFFLGEWYAQTSIGFWKALVSLLLVFSGGGLNFEDIGYGANNALWYLCVLLLCYVWYWCSLHICKRFKINFMVGFMILMFLGIAIVSYGWNFPYLNVASGRGYMCFFWGIVFGYILKKWYSEKLEWMLWIALIGGVALLFLSKGVFLDDSKALVFIIYPVIITLFAKSRFFHFLFGYKSFGVLGEISFEMYIWHGVWLIGLDFFLKWTGLLVDYRYIHMIGFTIVVFLWSSILYYFIEKKLFVFLKSKCNKG